MSKQPASELYQQFKFDIRDNKLPIGEPLKQEMLSERYGVSRIPIRDVMSRLKNEGWLVPHGKRGVMVPPYSATEAEDLYLMRMYLEPMILSHAIPRLNAQNLGEALDVLTTIDKSKGLTITEHGELNWQFHACLYRAAKRPTLFNTIANLHQQCGRYIGFHNDQLDYAQKSQAEHYHLIDAIKLKKISRAKSILKSHISDAGEQLVNYLSEKLHF